jgi:hypothetical protein
LTPFAQWQSAWFSSLNLFDPGSHEVPIIDVLISMSGAGILTVIAAYALHSIIELPVMSYRNKWFPQKQEHKIEHSATECVIVMLTNAAALESKSR